MSDLPRKLREELRCAPLDLAVVGHTNGGKTSIVRTFVHDATFGVVEDGPRITINCQAKGFSIDGMALAKCYDTPGFERATQILKHCGQDVDPQAILAYLRRPEVEDSGGWKSLHRKIVEKLLDSHCMLYVIDVSDEPKSEHAAELQILKSFGKPLLVLSNFETAQSTYHAEWRQKLKQIFGGLQLTPFDAHRRSPEDEDLLYDRLAANVEQTAHRKFLEFWGGYTKQQREASEDKAASVIAWVLLDLAAYEPSQSGVSDDRRKAVSKELTLDFQKAIEKRESAAMVAIAEAYGFKNNAVNSKALQEEARIKCNSSLWNKKNLVIAAAISGAAGGAIVDVSTGGLTLGFGTLVGGLTGGFSAYLAGFYFPEWVAETQTFRVRANKELLTLVLMRLIAIAEAVRTRGHGKEEDDPEEIPDNPGASFKHLGSKTEIPKVLEVLLPEGKDKSGLHKEMPNLETTNKSKAIQRIHKQLKSRIAALLKEIAADAEEGWRALRRKRSGS